MDSTALDLPDTSFLDKFNAYLAEREVINLEQENQIVAASMPMFGAGKINLETFLEAA
jgi:hypothetical protein